MGPRLLPYESVEELPDDRMLLRLRTLIRWIRRLALRLGATGRVVDPPELAAEVREAAAASRPMRMSPLSDIGTAAAAARSRR